MNENSDFSDFCAFRATPRGFYINDGVSHSANIGIVGGVEEPTANNKMQFDS
jgi:hypothetical protein